ncbi:MAG: TadE/TadG family type IV pilus assembly protein [Pirellula sp.]
MMSAESAGERSRRGAVSLEFGLVVPLFVAIVSAIFVGGIRVYQTQQYAAMAKFLVRKAIVHGQNAEKLGPWGPTTITGAVGDGTPVGSLMAFKFNNNQPMAVYYRLTWPDGGNNGLLGHRVSVTVASWNLSGGATSTPSTSTGSGGGLLGYTSSVTMSIAH